MIINKIEDQVMNSLLFGDQPVLSTLRKQYSVASVLKREQDISGFFTHFALPEGIEIIMNKPSFHIADVYGDISGLQYGVSFILFVSKGCIDFLECVTSNALVDKYPDDPIAQFKKFAI